MCYKRHLSCPPKPDKNQCYLGLYRVLAHLATEVTENSEDNSTNRKGAKDAKGNQLFLVSFASLRLHLALVYLSYSVSEPESTLRPKY